MNKSILEKNYSRFFNHLKECVASGRYEAIFRVNSELVLLYHQIGTEILKSQGSFGWGSKVIDQLAHDLEFEFPEMKGFAPRNLRYMCKLAQEYPRIVVNEFITQLPWGHNILIMDFVQNQEERMFYVKKVIENGWSRNILIIQIETVFHKHPGRKIPNFKTGSSPRANLVQCILKDPYFFDFLWACKGAHKPTNNEFPKIWKESS